MAPPRQTGQGIAPQARGGSPRGADWRPTKPAARAHPRDANRLSKQARRPTQQTPGAGTADRTPGSKGDKEMPPLGIEPGTFRTSV